MFDVYKKQVELEVNGIKETYTLVPLSGESMPKIFDLLKKLEIKEGMEDSDMLEKLDGDAIKLLHSVVLDTLIQSYPDQDKTKLDQFATQNLFQLFPVVMELNINQDNVKSK